LFILLDLRLHDGQSLADMNRVLRQLGQRASSATVSKLESRGLLRTQVTASGCICYLTSAGRDFTLRIAADLKSLEADVLGELDATEIVLLKQGLRRLMTATQTETPAPPTVVCK
jgi:DNA-binding MarR family transcriptional regulator